MHSHAILALLVFVAAVSSVWAGEPEPARLQALEQTKALLKTPEARQKAIAESPGSQLVGGQVRSLAGDVKTEDAIYGASAGIFDGLFHQTDGDPIRMKEILQKAKDDPKAFYESLGPEERRQIEGISRQIVDGRNGIVTSGPAGMK